MNKAKKIYRLILKMTESDELTWESSEHPWIYENKAYWKEKKKLMQPTI